MDISKYTGEIVSGIITLASTIIGALLGYALGRKKPKIVFEIIANDEYNDILNEGRKLHNKYSSSGYSVICYNTGNLSLMLTTVEFTHKGKNGVICNCDFGAVPIAPNDKYEYKLNEQEYDNFKWHTTEYHLMKCKITAYTLSKKKYYSSLDLEGLKIMWEVSADSVVV
ncbi:hypothetical protein LY28_02804 [Ruminiclostridium sufflavum DSM 19573]|uniref:Uncharacterized protein n=1 Tax=Ruminiclostridium sufflavum DSM 19573 TaxID=1121337 RepID=A0A318XJZ4_9FIRM|nr:hypothetical protein [Ruminiclostridium sufflavum]PYG86778.1 hypothetical protein LY28_02804 [Ruminiclostridium sufflavum DSM 19573]